MEPSSDMIEAQPPNPTHERGMTPWPEGKSEQRTVPSWNLEEGPEKAERSPEIPEEEEEEEEGEADDDDDDDEPDEEVLDEEAAGDDAADDTADDAAGAEEPPAVTY